MKIASIECIPLRIPFHYRPLGEPGTFRLYGRAWTHYEILLVKVQTDDGLVGWGESFAFGWWRSVTATMNELIAPMAIGRDAADISRLMFDMQLALLGVTPGMPMVAMSGLELALWDLAGKQAGLPLYRLLGSGAPSPLTAYQSLFWSEDRDAVAQVVRDSVAEGFRHIKLHSIEERSVRACREAAGSDVALMVDVNCRWLPEEGYRKAMALKPYDLYWLEEPLFPGHNYKQLAQLQRETGIPIATGENAFSASEFGTMFEAGPPAFVQPDIAMCGGVTEIRKIAALCAVAGVAFCPHLVTFGPSFLATLHVMAAEPRPSLVERFLLYPEAYLLGDLNHPVNAKYVVPDGPGLGKDPDPDVIREYRVKD